MQLILKTSYIVYYYKKYLFNQVTLPDSYLSAKIEQVTPAIIPATGLAREYNAPIPAQIKMAFKEPPLTFSICSKFNVFIARQFFFCLLC